MRRTPFSRHSARSLAGAVALALGLAAIPCAPLGAQTPAKASWVAPRTPDGHPDLQGVWANNGITPMTRPPNGRTRRS